MIYSVIVQETREFVYAFEALDQTDAMNKFIALDPKQPVPCWAAILQGPTQVDVSVSNITTAALGQEYICTNTAPQRILTIPTFDNPFESSYTATLRELRFTGYWVTCERWQLDSFILQLNPSIDVLPEGVTISMALQQSTVRPVYLYDPNGNYISWWV
jgi:hypothetical protein